MQNKKNIYLMYAIALLQGMVFYGPISTLYRQANGITVFQITIVESISYLLCILLEIPWGILADKIGYKKSMCFCCCLYLVSKIVFWQANGFFDFLSERIMLSVVIAGFSGVDSSILYLSCNKDDSQRVFSVYNSLGLTGLLLASFIFSAFIQSNYSMAAFLTVVCYGLAALLSLFLDEVKSAEKEAFHLANFKTILRSVIKDKKFILFLISIAFLSQTHQTITVFLNQIQYERCGMSNALIGYVYIIVTLAGLAGLLSDKLTKKIGIKCMGTVLYITAIASCIILGLTNSATFSVLSILLLNVSSSLFEPYQTQLQNEHVQSCNRATELSVYAMTINCVSAGTCTLFGVLADINLKISFFFGTAICLIGLFFSYIGHKSNH